MAGSAAEIQHATLRGRCALVFAIRGGLEDGDQGDGCEEARVRMAQVKIIREARCSKFSKHFAKCGTRISQQHSRALRLALLDAPSHRQPGASVPVYRFPPLGSGVLRLQREEGRTQGALQIFLFDQRDNAAGNAAQYEDTINDRMLVADATHDCVANTWPAARGRSLEFEP